MAAQNLTPDSFMSGLGSGSQPRASELTPDSFMAGQQIPTATPQAGVNKPQLDALTGLPLPQDARQAAEQRAQFLTDAMEQVGHQIRQSALQKAPYRLSGIVQPTDNPNDVYRNPDAPISKILDGAGRFATGVSELKNDKTPTGTTGMYGVPLPAPAVNDDMAAGASKMLSGGMDAAALPAIPIGVASAPLATVGGLAAGVTAQQGVSRGLKKAGISDAKSELAGDAAGLAAGGLVAHALPKPVAPLEGQVLPPERTSVDHQVEAPAPKGPQTIDLTPDQFMAGQETKPNSAETNTATSGTKGTTNDNTSGAPESRSQPEEQRQARQEGESEGQRPDGEARQSGGDEAAPGETPGEPAATLKPRPPGTPPAYGNAVNIKVPGESTVYPARYAVRELDDIEPSHNPHSFEPNPDYEYTNDRDYSNPQNAARVATYSAPGNFDADHVLTRSPTAEQGPTIIDPRGNALGGNNRAMTLSRVYASNGPAAHTYRDGVAAAAPQFGIDPEELQRFRNPILTRELTDQPTADQAQKAITDFNKVGASRLTPEEQAVTDGKRMSPRTIAMINGNLGELGDQATLAQALRGDRGAEIVNSLVNDGVLTRQEANGYVDDRDMLTPAAKDRIAKALVGRLFDQSAHFAETRPELRNKLERIAPQVIRVEDMPEWNITQPLRNALGLVADARAHKINLDDAASISDLNGLAKNYSPDVLAIAKTLERGPVNAARAFRQYANDAEMSRDGAQTAFFEPPTQKEAFDSAFRGIESGSLAAKRLTPVPPDVQPGAALPYADARFVAGAKPGEGKLYVNPVAQSYLNEVVGAVQDQPTSGAEGVSIRPDLAHDVHAVLADFAAHPDLSQEARAALQNVAREFGKAAADGDGAIAVVPNTQGRTLASAKQIQRQELFHREQYRVGEGTYVHHVDPMRFLGTHPVAERAANRLARTYRTRNAHVIAAELSAWLGAGQYAQLGISRGEALSVLAHYFDLLFEQHGSKALSVLARVQPDLRKDLYERYRHFGELPGGGASKGGKQPGSAGLGALRPGAGPEGAPQSGATGEHLPEGRQEGSGTEVQRDSSAADERKGFELTQQPTQGRLFAKRTALHGPSMFDAPDTGERSLFPSDDAKGVVESAAADKDRLARERMEAQLNSPLTRESQKQKLKRSTEQPQTSMFGSDEPDQGTLFSLIKPKDNNDSAKVNYSGLGAIETKTVRNLGQLRRASPEAAVAAYRAASSRSQASVVMKTAMPKLVSALKDIPKEDFFRALIQSRLTGIQQRWQQMADFATRASDDNLTRSMPNLLPVLEHIEDRAGFDRNLAETAARLAEGQAFNTLRKFLSDTFGRAARNVATVMEPAEFQALTQHPEFQRGLTVYKNLVEQPMADSHELNEGIFSTALGPLDTYYPLVPVDKTEHGPQAQRVDRQQYAKPKNPHNNFATGLAHDYEASADALRQSLTRAIHTNNKAALMDALEENGLVRPLSQFERGGDRVVVNGQEFDAVKVETSPGRNIIQNGKSTFLPPKQYLVPRWLHNELEPILARKDKMAPSAIQKIMNAVNAVAISGPADFVFHSSNLFGTLVANTPFLGDSLLGKAGSAPVLKKFVAIGKVLATDPTTEESARDLQEMAKLGILPDRYGSETYSKKFAELTGAKLHRLSAGPMLYGPKGVDVRARLVMYRLAKQINPGASGPELHLFVNQLGTYVDALQGQLVRNARKSGLAPFAEAGKSMLVNGINAWTGAGPTPKSGAGMRIWQQLTGGGIATVAMWMLAQKVLTGKYPWEDKRSKLLYLTAPDWARRSALGRALWGKGNETGYINFGFSNPLVLRGARALGIKGAYDAAHLDGKWWQDLEAAQKDVANSYAHPFLGPIPRALFVGLTGDEPYLTGFRDDRARFAPQFLHEVHGTAGKSVLERPIAAAKELNSFYGNVGAATGLGEQQEHDTSNRWMRMTFDLALPGLVGAAANPYAQRAKLLRQAAAAKRAR